MSCGTDGCPKPPARHEILEVSGKIILSLPAHTVSGGIFRREIKRGGKTRANLTSKELTALEDQIGCEATLVKKYEALACLCNDENIRQDFHRFAQQHRAHYNTLVTFLQ